MVNKRGVKEIGQSVWLCLIDFGKNGLANHAAAGAYGFLLSLTPAMLVAASVFSAIFPHLKTADLLGEIVFLGFSQNAFDIEGTIIRFLTNFNTGLVGVFSLASMFWAAIVLAFSIQRGLNSIFTDKKPINTLKSWLIPLCLELAVIAIVIIFALSAYLTHAFMKQWLFSAFCFVGLGVLTFGVYCAVPNSPPKWKSALFGATLCVVSYAFILVFPNLFINHERYYLIYGRLGGLISLLARVYFFFLFFFIGAQFAFTVEFLDVLLFTKLIAVNMDEKGWRKPLFIERFLFSSVEGRLWKYRCSYKKGETIFLKGEQSHTIFYLLSGEVGVYLTPDNKVASIAEHNFFGEMGYVLSSIRSAAAKAETDLVVMALPPALFNAALQIDQNTGTKIIETLSKRLQDMNKKLSKLSGGDNE
ncbi:MAG: YihY/virulence factor BrkB family protein [Treponema sp.]|jgi:membrane protein|nr:YihY/virulence factor BrkB family protein [Treponema sp.]